MKNLRFKFVVASSPLFVSWAVPRANYMIKHADKYSEEERYKFALVIVKHMAYRSRTRTKCYGSENLPEEGGYILYSNHQGKYDALGIMLHHKKPLSMLWEEKSANRIVARQVAGLVDGKTINFTDFKGTIKTLGKLADEVVQGRRYLVFPEGGYKDNKNELQEFKSGCFMCALKSKAPIVPVAIYDSWRAMDTNTFEKVITQVHYLEPIYYEEYSSMKKKEISDLVKSRISAKLQELKDKEITG